MKNLIVIVIALFISVGLFAKDNNVVKEEFYTNGNLKAQFVSLDNGLIEATYFFESGAVYETGFFKEGKLTGKWITYTVESEIQTVGFFTDNNKSGTWTMYKNGKIISEINYSENLARK